MNKQITWFISLCIIGATLALLVASSSAQAPGQGNQEERIDKLEKRLAEMDGKLGNLEKLLSNIETATKRNGDIMTKGFDELIKRSPPPKP